MSDYRSDLRAAKERIEQLEAELAVERVPLEVGMRKDQLLSPARIGLSVILLVPIMLAGAAATCAITRRTSAPPEALGGQAAPADANPLGSERRSSLPAHLRWYEEPGGSGPWFSSSGLIIGWMRDDTRLGDNLRVVAIDRQTQKARWVSARAIAGIPATGGATTKSVLHLALVPPSWVVATDARGYAIVLREGDGVEVARHFIGEGGVEEACPVSSPASTSEAFLALDARYWRPRYPGDVGQTLNPVEKHRQRAFLLDVDHGVLRPATARVLLGASCSTECLSPRSKDDWCRLPRPDVLPQTSLSSDGATTWVSTPDLRQQQGDYKVSIGPTLDGVRLLSAVGATTKNTWLWTETIPTREHPQQRGSRWLATVKDGFLHVIYQTERGPWRHVSFEVKSGARLHEFDVPLSNTGTRVQSLSVDRSAIFLAMNDELYVLDSSTGAIETRMQVSPGEAEAPPSP